MFYFDFDFDFDSNEIQYLFFQNAKYDALSELHLKHFQLILFLDPKNTQQF